MPLVSRPRCRGSKIARTKPHDGHNQHQLPKWIADQPDEAAREIGRLAARLRGRDPKGEKAHNHVEDATDHIAKALEQLELGVRRRMFDSPAAALNCHLRPPGLPLRPLLT